MNKFKLSLLFFTLLFPLKILCAPLPVLYKQEQLNTDYWGEILALILMQKEGSPFQTTLEETPHTAALLMEGKVPFKFKRDLRRLLSCDFSTTTLLKALDDRHLKLSEITTDQNPYRQFKLTLISSGLDIPFVLKSPTPLRITTKSQALDHACSVTILLHAPHPLIGQDVETLYGVRKLAHQGFLEMNPRDGSFRAKENKGGFIFLFPPLMKQELSSRVRHPHARSDYFNKEHALYDRCLQLEGTSISALYQLIQSLYDANFDSKLDDPHYTYQLPLKAPKIHHKIWFTDPKHPREFPDKYFTWWEESLPKMKPEDGWQHWLWIEDPSLLPKTVERAKKLGITLKNIWKDCSTIKTYKSEMMFTLKKKWFSAASDIFRIILCNEFGGAYLDTDYRVYRDLTPLLQHFDLCLGHEPCSAKVGSSFVLSRADHPVLKKFLAFIKIIYDTNLPPQIITEDNPIYDELMRYSMYGSSFAIALALATIKPDPARKDIVLPPMYLYPTHETVYPIGINNVFVPGETPPPHSFANHYWELSWLK